MNNKAVETQIASLYDVAMPYHNFKHAQMVLEAGLQMLDKCKLEGISVDEEVVYYACLLHDAGYHEDEQAKGFSSKEAYSAHLAKELLAEHAVASQTVTAVMTAIMSTHCDGVCKSNEDKLVRAADLSHLAVDYVVFKKNAKKLQEEYFLLHGLEISWQKWCKEAVAVIELFLREEMALTKDYYNTDGESVFHLKVRENLHRLLNDESCL